MTDYSRDFKVGYGIAAALCLLAVPVQLLDGDYSISTMALSLAVACGFLANFVAPIESSSTNAETENLPRPLTKQQIALLLLAFALLVAGLLSSDFVGLL